MPIFLPPTVTRAPNEWLRSWAVFELLVPKLGERTRHVAGDVSDGSGRVSSPLVAIDEANRSVVTRSGRVYRLVGGPGLGLEGEYVWRNWLSGSDARDVQDVTAEIHVAGVRVGGEGRVSSPVAKVDGAGRCVVTSTGRVYRLIGAPGLQGDACYVWNRWLWKWNAKVLSDAAPALVHSFEQGETSNGDAAS